MWKTHKDPNTVKRLAPQTLPPKKPDVGLIVRDPRTKTNTSVVNEKRLIPLLPVLFQYWQYWLRYPDALFDLLKPADTAFDLKNIQRFVLRMMSRKKISFLTATRGFSKSFIGVLGNFFQCMLIPRCKATMCANTEKQIMQIGREKINELTNLLPLLKQEVNWSKGSQTAFANDYIRLVFHNKSELDCTVPKESARGGRRHSLTVEEVKDAKRQEINEIAIPLLNAPRATVLGDFNPHEVQQKQVYVGSAGYTNSFGYDKCVEVLVKSMFEPEKYICFGFDYTLPVYYGLLAKDFLDDIKDDSTYDPTSFSREYSSIWSSTIEGSAFDYQKLEGLRRVRKAENLAAKADNVFYTCSVDVALTSARTVASVIKVYKRENSWHKKIVNIITMEGRNFKYQATKIKQLDEAFNFDHVVVDANGLGRGLMEALMDTNYDAEYSTMRPGWNVINHDERKEYKKENILGQQFKIHALISSNIAEAIDTTAYQQLMGGKVELLISEYEARTILFDESVPMKDRVKGLEPYKNTTLFINETNNLRLVQTENTTKFKIQRISTSQEKDTYSSVSYGLYVLYEYYEKPFFLKQRKGKTSLLDAVLVN